MARIRSIKPSFFRHEKLQELGAEAMLVFAGLWTQCDSKGRFEWKPRHLKLDILPFLDFDMEGILDALAAENFVTKYEVDGRHYGEISSFLTHQRITGKESVSGEHYPGNPKINKGNTWEAPGKQPVAQEEEEEIGRGKDKRPDVSPWKIFRPTVEELFGRATSHSSEIKSFQLVNDLAALGATPEELRARTAHYRLCWPDVACTLKAVLNNWNEIPALKPKGGPNGARKPSRTDRLEQDARDLADALREPENHDSESLSENGSFVKPTGTGA